MKERISVEQVKLRGLTCLTDIFTGRSITRVVAKDLFHEAVKIALQKDGWQITHDPYYLEALGTEIQIDLGAEKLIGAQRDREYIVVEVKSFIGPSLVYDFHLALG